MKSSAWDELRDEDCQACSLCETAQSVCLIGDGPRETDGMIVGEAPGYREDNIQIPFSGRAGQYLTQCLLQVGVDRDECFVTNVVHCRPPENRTPSQKEIKACKPFLDAEIEWAQPKVVLVLGNTALKGVMGLSGITKWRGAWTCVDGINYVPTYHPAAVLRNPRYLPEFMADLSFFGDLLAGRAQESTDTEVRVVLDRASAKDFLCDLKNSTVFAYDVETNGLDELEDGAKLWVLGFSFERGKAWVLPVDHPERAFSAESVLRMVKPYFEDGKRRQVAHNAMFDNRWLQSRGVNPHTTFDTMLASYILNENEAHGLKPLASTYLRAPSYSENVDFSDLDELATYNGKDCDYTLRLYEMYRKRLKKKSNRSSARIFVKLLMPATRSIEGIVSRGIYVHMDTLLKVEKVLKAAVQSEVEWLDEAAEACGLSEVNWNAPKQVGRFLFGDSGLGLEIIEMTKGGDPSTAEGSLIRLKGQHEAIEHLLEYRRQSKYLSTYINSWYEKLREDGRIHPRYLLHGTVTGRLSSRQPNLQQVPRNPLIRQILGAEPGWVLVQADYSQIELRIAAYLAQEQEMLRAFQAGEDIHLKTGRIITGKEELTSEERKKAKAVNFGFLYGMGAKKMKSYAMEKYEIDMSLGEATRIRDTHFRAYPGLKPWHARMRNLANKYQQVRSPIGRLRRLPDILSQDEEVRAEAERQAINSPVQSFASDLMLMSMIELDPMFEEDTIRIVGSVHDSLLFEIREGEEDKWIPVIKRVMEHPALMDEFGVDMNVPIEVEIKTGTNWGYLKVKEV